MNKPTTGRISVVDGSSSNVAGSKEADAYFLLEQGKENSGLSILILLFSLLSGQVEEGQALNTAQGSLAAALGLDNDSFLTTIRGVRSGNLSPDGAAERTFSSIKPSAVDWSSAGDINLSELVGNNTADTFLHPDLVDRMESNPRVRQMVQWTFEAAERRGVDGNLLANQLWQESRFNQNAVSPAGASGVGQFMPAHKGKWGLETESDFFDPQKSIEASARFMRHLTDKMGSQQLALVAYNGGGGAIEYADRNVSGDGVTIDQWMGFMHQERLEKGVGASHLWRNETFGYIKKIDPRFWEGDLLARAEQQVASSQSAAMLAFNTGGKDEVAASTNTPNPSAHFDGDGGVDQVALAAASDVAPTDGNPDTAPVIPGVGSKA